MKFKKCVALFLVAIMLFSLSGCDSKPANVYTTLRKVFDNNTFNTVINLTLTTMQKQTENQKYTTYNFYVDADSDITEDKGRLYAKYSIDEAPYEYLCRYERNKNTVFYNLDDFIKFNAFLANMPLEDTEALKNNIGANYEYGIINTDSILFKTFNNTEELNVLTNFFSITDAFGEKFFDFLADEKIAIKNDESSFTEINIDTDSLITIIDYIEKEYTGVNGIKQKLTKAIKDSDNENIKIKDNDNGYLILHDLDFFINSWSKFSNKEKEAFINEKFTDFNLRIIMDTTTPNLIIFNVIGNYSNETTDARISGEIKFRPAEPFVLTNIDSYADYDVYETIKAIFAVED